MKFAEYIEHHLLGCAERNLTKRRWFTEKMWTQQALVGYCQSVSDDVQLSGCHCLKGLRTIKDFNSQRKKEQLEKKGKKNKKE